MGGEAERGVGMDSEGVGGGRLEELEAGIRRVWRGLSRLGDASAGGGERAERERELARKALDRAARAEWAGALELAVSEEDPMGELSGLEGSRESARRGLEEGIGRAEALRLEDLPTVFAPGSSEEVGRSMRALARAPCWGRALESEGGLGDPERAGEAALVAALWAEAWKSRALRGGDWALALERGGAELAEGIGSASWPMAAKSAFAELAQLDAMLGAGLMASQESEAALREGGWAARALEGLIGCGREGALRERAGNLRRMGPLGERCGRELERALGEALARREAERIRAAAGEAAGPGRGPGPRGI